MLDPLHDSAHDGVCVWFSLCETDILRHLCAGEHMFLQECAFFALVDNELHVMEGDRVKNHCLIVAPKEGVVTTL